MNVDISCMDMKYEIFICINQMTHSNFFSSCPSLLRGGRAANIFVVANIRRHRIIE